MLIENWPYQQTYNVTVNPINFMEFGIDLKKVNAELRGEILKLEQQIAILRYENARLRGGQNNG